jgi:F0F1-type ATP synthase assembly protein I
MTQKSKTVEKVQTDEEKVLESYRAAKQKAKGRPMILTIYLVSGIVQVWEGQPKGTAK